MKVIRYIAAALALAAIPLGALSDTPVVGPVSATFNASSQSAVFNCNQGGQSTFQLKVPAGLTGTFTVTVGATSTTATDPPPNAFAPGIATYTNTITNSGSLTVSMGSNLYVKVADTSYTSGSTTVSGTCSIGNTTVPASQLTTPYPAATSQPAAAAPLSITQPTCYHTLVGQAVAGSTNGMTAVVCDGHGSLWSVTPPGGIPWDARYNANIAATTCTNLSSVPLIWGVVLTNASNSNQTQSITLYNSNSTTCSTPWQYQITLQASETVIVPLPAAAWTVGLSYIFSGTPANYVSIAWL